jgi:hypothetical protein
MYFETFPKRFFENITSHPDWIAQWNSAFHMLKAALKLWKAIDMAVIHHDCGDTHTEGERSA